MDLFDYIPVIKDFPKKGIAFRDISPLLANSDARNAAVAQMATLYESTAYDVIAGIESRGFIFGVCLAEYLNKPFVMIRKADKLPPETFRVSYELEYGSDHLEIRKGLLNNEERVLIVDDVLATGGTILAAQKLLQMAGARAIGSVTLLEIEPLHGSDKLNTAGLLHRSLLRTN